MKRVKRIVTALCILFPVFLLLVCSVILVGVTDDNDDGNPKHASGLGLSDKVREYSTFTFVEKDKQKRAVQFLIDEVFTCPK